MIKIVKANKTLLINIFSKEPSVFPKIWKGDAEAGICINLAIIRFGKNKNSSYYANFLCGILRLHVSVTKKNYLVITPTLDLQ
jgi:hypothetical protein